MRFALNIMHRNNWSRRRFITTSFATGISMALAPGIKAAVAGTGKLKLGLIADLHHDIVFDAQERLDAFAQTMQKAKPDAIIQLGDFAYPNKTNEGIINKFNGIHANNFHVIGNHDTDNGHTHDQCLAYWGMPSAYYAAQLKNYTIIVLNGNDKGSPAHKGGYPAYIGPAQQQWLQLELEKATGPVVLFCHQPLKGYLAIDNADEIQQLLTKASDKIVAIINGHTHIDQVDYIGSIPQITINAASYFWVGGKYKHESYPADIYKDHPWMAYTCPYQKSLFATLTIDPRKNNMVIRGSSGSWVGPSPQQLGFTEPALSADVIVPHIMDRKIVKQA